MATEQVLFSPLPGGGTTTTAWPSLAESMNHHHQPTPTQSLSEDWEVLSPSSDADNDLDDIVVVSPPRQTSTMTMNRPQLFRQRSSSVPDFQSISVRQLSRVGEEGDDAEETEEIELIFHNVGPTLPQKTTTAANTTSNPWTSNQKTQLPSFRDMVLSQVQELAKELTEDNNTTTVNNNDATPVKPKLKPKFVVTPVAPLKRCAYSTPNLRSYDTELDEEVLGDTDSAEYYSRKAMGYSGRKNGLKIRPDEAKRKDFSLHKKQMQRRQQQQQQQQKQR